MYLLLTISCGIFAFASGQTTQAPCEEGWPDYNGNCYFIADNKRASWSDALRDCENRQADLLILEIPEELDFIVNEFSDAKTDGVWTRLKRQLDLNVFEWDVNYPPDSSVVTWNTEPDNANGNENCGALNEQGGFSDNDCLMKFGFICEITNTNCPESWLVGNGQCFYISNTYMASELMTWQQANAKCASFGGSTLVDLSDYDAQGFITSELPELTQTTIPWWVSLNRKNSQWYWGDSKLAQDVDTMNWVKEPNNLGGGENCVLLYANGKMADKDCDTLANYACKKSDNSVPISDTNRRLGCGAWQRGGSKCYYFQNDSPETHDVAQQKCVEKGGQLLKIETLDEQNFITYMTRYYSHTYWTQLTAPSNTGVFTYADGSRPAAGIVQWNVEPNDYSGVQDCIAILEQDTWVDGSCGTDFGYICKAISDGQGCPGNWTSYGTSGFCYFFGPLPGGSRLNWWIARRTCINMAKPLVGNLLYVDTPEELAWINSQLYALPDKTPLHWTGLNDVAAEGTLVYDGIQVEPRLDIIPWNIAPSCKTCSPDCTIFLLTGQLTDTQCERSVNYVCEKEPYHVSAGAISVNTQTTSAGAILAISVFLTMLM